MPRLGLYGARGCWQSEPINDFTNTEPMPGSLAASWLRLMLIGDSGSNDIPLCSSTCGRGGQGRITCD